LLQEAVILHSIMQQVVAHSCTRAHTHTRTIMRVWRVSCTKFKCTFTHTHTHTHAHTQGQGQPRACGLCPVRTSARATAAVNQPMLVLARYSKCVLSCGAFPCTTIAALMRPGAQKSGTGERMTGPVGMSAISCTVYEGAMDLQSLSTLPTDA
jgi:hypothetical protein